MSDNQCACSGFNLNFTRTVKVAGQLDSFNSKVYSAISVFGIDTKNISTLIDGVIDFGLKKEITDKLVQKELAALQAKLQQMANQIWPSESSQDLCNDEVFERMPRI